MQDSRSHLYTFFFILFLPDTWQILMGIILAIFLTPVMTSPEMGVAAKIMLYLMTATIGYAASGIPAKGIVRILKKVILAGKKS